MAAPRPLAVSTIALRREPVATALAVIREARFRAIELGAMPGFCPHFDFEGPAAQEEELRALVARHGLSVCSLTTALGDPNVPGFDAAAYARRGARAVGLAALLGAATLNVACGVTRDRALYPFDGDLSAMAAVLVPLADVAASEGVRLIVEAPHKGNLVRTPDEALRLLERCAHPNVGLVYDVNHHHAAGWTPVRSVNALGAARIGVVHLRDAIGRDNRFPLGAGEVDFAQVFAALDKAGYAGPVSLEFVDPAPDTAGVVRELQRARAHLESQGADPFP